MNRAAKATLVLAPLALLAVALFYAKELWRAPPPAPLPSVSSAPAAAPALPPGMIADSLNPERPLQLDAARPVPSADWAKARPTYLPSRSPAERGGIEPCATQQFDASAFGDWQNLSKGHFIAPRELSLDPAGRFELVIHLHGDEPVLRELVESQQHFVLYTLTVDMSQSYAPLFTGTHLYESIVAEIEKALSKRTGRDVHAGHVALSAWSAGFVGIEAALAQPVSRDVDAVVLIDGLHAPRGDRAAFEAQLKPFVEYARRAAAGERFMFVSHSSIDPPDFASTTECAHYLLQMLDARPQPVRREERMGLELIEYFSRADLHVRGYAGSEKADHCAQLALLRDAYRALGKRWSAGYLPSK